LQLHLDHTVERQRHAAPQAAMQLSGEQAAAVADLARQMFARVEALSLRQNALEAAASRYVPAQCVL